MNFDYIRLLLATTVMFVHLKIIPNNHPVFNSEIAVLFFFCISGFLITQSYINSQSLEAYLKKRVARIYPPIVCTFLALCTIGLLTNAGQPFFRGAASLLVFQDWLVITNPVNPDPNGVYALGTFWTLVIELQFYLLIPFIIFGLQTKQKTTLAILLLVYFASHFIRRFTPETQDALAYRLNIMCVAHFFIAGIITAFYAPKLVEKPLFFKIIAPIALAVFLFLQYRGNQYITHLMPFAMVIIILAIAKISAGFGKKSVFGDLSYGVYLYHMVVVTAFDRLLLFDRLGFGDLVLEKSVCEAIVTFSVAFISWHLVEKRFIAMAHRTVNKA